MRVLFVSLVFILSFELYSADTTETFELGFSDYEYYYEISNLKANKKTFSHEFTIGAGITNSLASTFTIGAEKFDNLSELNYAFGLFFNVFESRYVDFDLYTSMDNLFELALGFELNLDLKDNLELAGFYLRTEASIIEEIEAYYFTFGGYYSFIKNAQLLLEFDLAVPTKGNLDIGGLAFGLNYAFSDRFELITNLGIDIPQSEENLDFSFTIGFISTL